MTVLTYPKYNRPSGWNAMLPLREARPALSADATADVVVIGAGFTGIAAASRWSEHRPDDAVVLLDSSEVGEGSPGRNSGFLLEIALANDADPRAMQRMSECNRLIAATMNTIRDAVFDGGIDCAIERAGTYRAAAGEHGRRALERYRTFLDGARLPYDVLNRKELEERLGTAFYAEGLYSPHCYLVQPAALVRGLAARLAPSISLHENTPATAVRRDRSRWIVETPNGQIGTKTVIVANNAFASGLGVARANLVTMFTYAGLTEPLTGRAELCGSERSWGLLPAHRLGCTLRRTRDGRLLIRSGYSYAREKDNALIARQLLASLHDRFPELPDTGFDAVWGGATGITRNGAPVWGRHRPGLYVSAGCNGGGVVKGTLFGAALTDLALERTTPDIRSLFGRASWLPPEPLRRVGFLVMSRFERRQGRAEM